MFGIGFPELVVIFIVALLVLGPERLPEVARGAARWVMEIRRAADELKKELGSEEIQKGKEEIEKVKQNLLKEVYVPPEPDELSPTPIKRREDRETQEEMLAKNGSKKVTDEKNGV